MNIFYRLLANHLSFLYVYEFSGPALISKINSYCRRASKRSYIQSCIIEVLDKVTVSPDCPGVGVAKEDSEQCFLKGLGKIALKSACRLTAAKIAKKVVTN